MTRRLSLLALGATLLTWTGTGLPTAAQDKHTGHGGAKQSPHGADNKMLDRMLAGMSAGEKKYIQGHMAKMSPAQRKMMMDHMMRMSPAERRKMVQQMMKGGGMDGMMHGHGKTGGHGAHDNHSGGARHAQPPSGDPRSGKTQEPVALAVGEQVPDFAVRDLQGRSHRLSDLRKQTKSGAVTLTFWCSFCHSCRHMEARLDLLARTYKGKAAVAAVDASAGETSERVTAFAKKKGLTVPILLDSEGKTADLFGVGVTTTTVVIDGQGVLRYRGQFADRERLFAEKALKAILAGDEVRQKETSLRG